MRSPLQTYKNERDKATLRKDTFEFFQQKYVSSPFQEYGFLETEERFAVQKLKFFIPGRIYMWSYDPLYKDYLDYYDKQPMVLVHSQFVSKAGNMIVQGLNLNFIPEEQRAQTLELFWRIFKKDIEAAEESAAKDQPGLLREAWKFLTDWYFTVKIFNEQGRIGYQWAYRNYIIPRIKQPVIIELEDWERIPYFIPKEFEGKPPAKIWSEYLMYKDQLSKKAVDQKRAKDNQKKYRPPGG
jgi:hypothetical protein